MCCLFGLLDYRNNFTPKQRNKLILILSTACEARGTDATGISYNHNGRLCIYKRPLAARKIKFNIPQGVNYVMGHTRMTTQGNEKFNYNNHPFPGTVDNADFALAHNGVLYNDTSLRRIEELPETKIETDSYVAVQLIEKKKLLGFDSLKYMAEQLQGSFTITVMDHNNNLYFVKGDNPMCLYHYPSLGIYLYASTEEILKKAIKKFPFKLGTPLKINLVAGDIFRIDRFGRTQKTTFNTDNLFSSDYFHFPYLRYSAPLHIPSKRVNTSANREYIEYLKSSATFYGFTEDMVDEMLDEGYTTDDIEDILYCGAWG